MNSSILKMAGRACIFALLVGVAAPVAFAAPSGQEIAQLEAMLEAQAELDTAGVATKDRQTAAKWLQEAKVLLANGDEDQAARRLKRVAAALDLIRAMVSASIVRQQAEEQEAAAYQAPDTMAELRAEVESLQQQRDQLQRELLRLRR